MTNFVLLDERVDLTRKLAQAIKLHRAPGQGIKQRVLLRLFKEQLVRPGYLIVQPFAELEGMHHSRTLQSYQISDEYKVRGQNFWGTICGGSGILVNYLFNNPNIVRGKSVLDLGCGSGTATLAAKLCGASAAMGWDPDSMAVTATLANAELNGLTVKAKQRDVLAPWPEGIDVVMAGDVIKPGIMSPLEIAEATMRIEQFRMGGGTVLLADSYLRKHVPQYGAEPNKLPSQMASLDNDWGIVVLGPR